MDDYTFTMQQPRLKDIHALKWEKERERRVMGCWINTWATSIWLHSTCNFDTSSFSLHFAATLSGNMQAYLIKSVQVKKKCNLLHSTGCGKKKYGEEICTITWKCWWTIICDRFVAFPPFHKKGGIDSISLEESHLMRHFFSAIPPLPSIKGHSFTSI